MSFCGTPGHAADVCRHKQRHREAQERFSKLGLVEEKFNKGDGDLYLRPVRISMVARNVFKLQWASGADVHATGDRLILSNIRRIPEKIFYGFVPGIDEVCTLVGDVVTRVLVDGVVKEFVFEDVHYFEKMSGTLISHCILAHLGYKFNGDACSKDSLRDLVHCVTRDNEVAFNVVQPKTSSRMFVQVQEIPKLASATQVNKSRGVAEVPVSPHDTVKSVGMKVCNSECANQDSWIPKLKPLRLSKRFSAATRSR